MSDVNVTFTEGLSSGTSISNFNNVCLVATDRATTALPSNWGTTKRVRKFINLQEVEDSGISKTSRDYYQAMQYFRESNGIAPLYMGIFRTYTAPFIDSIESVIHEIMALYPEIDVLGFYDTIDLDKAVVDGLNPIIRKYHTKEYDNKAFSIIYSADTTNIDREDMPTFADVENGFTWVLVSHDEKGYQEFGMTGGAIVGTALGRAVRRGIAASMNDTTNLSINSIDKNGYLLEPFIPMLVGGSLVRISQTIPTYWTPSFEQELKDKHINYARREALMNGTYFATDLTAFKYVSGKAVAPSSLYQSRAASKACRIIARAVQGLKGTLYAAQNGDIASEGISDIKAVVGNSVNAMRGIEFVNFDVISVTGYNFDVSGKVDIKVKAEFKRTLEQADVELELTVGGLV